MAIAEAPAIIQCPPDCNPARIGTERTHDDWNIKRGLRRDFHIGDHRSHFLGAELIQNGKSGQPETVTRRWVILYDDGTEEDKDTITQSNNSQ